MLFLLFELYVRNCHLPFLTHEMTLNKVIFLVYLLFAEHIAAQLPAQESTKNFSITENKIPMS